MVALPGEKFNMITDSEMLYGVSLCDNKMIAAGYHDFIVKTDTAWGTCEMFGCDFLETDYINTHYRFEDLFFSDVMHGWAVGKRSYTPVH